MENIFFEEIDCPVCDGNNYNKYIETTYGDLKKKKSLDYSCIGVNDSSILRTVKCKNCSFVYTNPRPKKEAEVLVYNEAKKNLYEIKDYKEVSANDIRRKLAYARNTLAVLDHLKVRDQTNVFDYGSGFGHTLMFTKSLGLTGYGVDIDKHRIEICKNYGLNVSNKDAFFNQFGPIKADVIFMQSVIEHVIDLNDTFQFISQLSKEDTILFINGCHPRLIDIEKKKGTFIKAHFIEHINYFYIKTLDFYLEKFGYQPIKNRTYTKHLSKNFHLLKTLLQLNLPIGLVSHFTGYFDRLYINKTK